MVGNGDEAPAQQRQRSWTDLQDIAPVCQHPGALCSGPVATVTRATATRGKRLQYAPRRQPIVSHGTWRSPVAHCNGVAGVAGSNPAVPIEKERAHRPALSRSGRQDLAVAPRVGEGYSVQIRVGRLGIEPESSTDRLTACPGGCVARRGVVGYPRRSVTWPGLAPRSTLFD